MKEFFFFFIGKNNNPACTAIVTKTSTIIINTFCFASNSVKTHKYCPLWKWYRVNHILFRVMGEVLDWDFPLRFPELAFSILAIKHF